MDKLTPTRSFFLDPIWDFPWKVSGKNWNDNESLNNILKAFIYNRGHELGRILNLILVCFTYLL